LKRGLAEAAHNISSLGGPQKKVKPCDKREQKGKGEPAIPLTQERKILKGERYGPIKKMKSREIFQHEP